MQDVKEHVDESIAAHGILHEDDEALPTPYISILRSFPLTGVLSTSHSAYTKRLNRPYDFVYCYPTKLADYLPAKDGKPSKRPTSSQSGHTDGEVYMATSSPSWVSLLITISVNAFVRIWEYSHDLVERLYTVQQTEETCTNEVAP